MNIQDVINSLPVYTQNDPLMPIPLDDLLTERVRSRDGDYDVVLLDTGSVLYRGIDGRDCLTKAAQDNKYGKWYGSILVASHYAKQNDIDNKIKNETEKSAVCAVRIKKVCRLLNMSDPNTRTLVIERLAIRDKQSQQQGIPKIVYKGKQTSLQQLFSKAFGYKNTYLQRLQSTKPKQRVSSYGVDQLLVMEIMKLFPRVDGYIYINTWGQAYRNFHNELNLFRPQSCVELLDEKSNKKLFRLCLESFFIVGKTRQRIVLERKKDAKILLEQYFPVSLPVWKQQFRQFLVKTTQSQIDAIDTNIRQIDSMYMDAI